MSTMIQVTEPTMVLNEEVCKSNIARMAAKAKAANVVFRPHFKTHQSREIGEWFRASGVDKITVSSLNMAMKFAEWGWNDITVAFPVNCLEHEKINALAAKIRLNLLLVHSEGARQLSECLKYPVGVYLGVDTGYHRDGVDAGNYEKIERIMNIVAPDVNIKFEGFLTHAGHTYNAVLKKKFCRFIKTICACLKISKKDILIAILSSRFL
ncbi:MAG: alanine racemase [Odoribacter splanchnicus]